MSKKEDAKKKKPEIDSMVALNNSLDKTKLPPAVKSEVMIGAALNVDPDTIMKGAVSIMDSIETVEAESENKKQESIPDDYTEVEKQIVDMLIANTGCSILDSGGSQGRHWEKNRKIADFREIPVMHTTVWNDGQVELSLDLFHFLTAMLEIDDTSNMLNAEFKEFAEKSEESSKHWPDIIEDFNEKLGEHDMSITCGTNTYNMETMLSQVIQYHFIHYGNDLDNMYDNAYIVLQIHNGCDVRGGYTSPRIFRIADIDQWYLSMATVGASCSCGMIYSDDSGYHWFNENEVGSLTLEGYNLPNEWVPKPKPKTKGTDEKVRNWEYELVCTKCGEKVDFFPDLDL